MTVENQLGRFYIYRGSSVFCFFVDDEWSKKTWQGRSFASYQKAYSVLKQIRVREKLRKAFAIPAKTS